ncbi:serine-type endopeptidase [Aureococcus anophagefferens]|nr:serine-type endopeptidase [Aureococcus anophagefferens]
MKHLAEGVAVTRHLESGKCGKICIRGDERVPAAPPPLFLRRRARDAPRARRRNGVEWDNGPCTCCSDARKGFEWTELREVRTYSKESCHPTPTLAKSPMPNKNEIALTFSLILADDWSLDVTCHSAPGHHLAVRGFELARKHHMQEGHKINVRVDDSSLTCLQRWTKALHHMHLLYAENKHSSHGGGSRIVVGAAVEVAYAHSIEAAHAVFDPNATDPTGQPVRSYPYRVKIPRGYMRFPTRAWHEGQYVMGHVKKFDRKTELYTIEYKSGPYKQTEGPRLNLGPPVKGLPDATIIEECHRAFLSVDEATKSDNFPFLMLLISIAQVVCFGYWAPKMDKEISATTPVAGPQYLWFKTLVHSGLEHIGFNIILQLIFGIPIELIHGAIIFFIYEMGVVCGALACVMSDPYIAVVGCSGGVYCLFGIHVAHMILNWSDMKHSAIPREVRLLIFFLLFASETGTWWFVNTAGKSYAAHAGGAFCGLFMGLGFMTNFEIECWETVLRWLARVGLLTFPRRGHHVLFECDIERKFKYYDHFECDKSLEDDKNSYQYNLEVGSTTFQECNDIRRELNNTFGCGDCGNYGD